MMDRNLARQELGFPPPSRTIRFTSSLSPCGHIMGRTGLPWDLAKQLVLAPGEEFLFRNLTTARIEQYFPLEQHRAPL